MLRFAFSNILKNKLRFLLVSLTIIVGVCFSTTVLLIGDSMNKNLDQLRQALDIDSITLQVQPRAENGVDYGNLYSRIDDQFIEDLENKLANAGDYEALQEIDILEEGQQSFDVYGRVSVANFDNRYDISFALNDGAGREVISGNPEQELEAIDIISDYSDQKSHNLFIISQGKFPANDREVALDEDFAEAKGIAIGDTVSLTVNRPYHRQSASQKELEVVGFSQRKLSVVYDTFALSLIFDEVSEELDQQLFLDHQYIVLNTATSQEVLGFAPDQYTISEIYLRIPAENLTEESEHKVYQLEGALWSIIAEGTSEHDIRIVPDSVSGVFFIPIAKLTNTIVLYIISGFIVFAMIISIFVVVNTFNVIIVQRTRELAVLRALAFSKSQVYRLIMLEAALMGLMACLIGIVAAIVLAGAILEIGQSAGISVLDFNLSLKPTNFIFPVILGVVITLLSALTPAIKASRLTIVEGLAENNIIEPKSLKARTIVGSIVAGLAMVILFFVWLSVNNLDLDELGQVSGTSLAIPYALLGLSLVVSFIACMILMPNFVKLISGLVKLAVRPVFAKIAFVTDNLKRNAKRSASTANALFIGVFLIIFLNISISSIQKTIQTSLDNQFDYGWSIYKERDDNYQTRDQSSSEIDRLHNDLRKVEGLTDLNLLREIHLRFSLPDDGLTAPSLDEIRLAQDISSFGGILVVDPDTINSVTGLELDDETIDKLNQGQVLVLDSAVNEGLVPAASQYEVVLRSFDSQGEPLEQIYRTAGNFEEDQISIYGISYIMSDTSYYQNQLELPGGEVSFRANTADGQEADQLEESLKKVLDRHSYYDLEGPSIILRIVDKIFGIVLNIFRVLLSLSFLVAFIGIFNSLSLAVLERFREIGILRANGMTKNQIRNMINTEAVIVILTGLTVGVAVGLLFSWLFFSLLSKQTASQTDEDILVFSLPYLDILVYYLIAVIAALVASALPAYQATRLDIVKAISKSD